jgi:hypothetical protein
MEDPMITEREPEEIQEPDDTQLMDRRRMLTAFAATAAGVVGAMALPTVAAAATGDAVHSGSVSDASLSDPGLWGRNWNLSGGVGVLAESHSGDAIVGYSEGVNKSGIWAKNVATGGAGVTGDGAVAGVVGRTPAAAGYGVLAIGGAGGALKVDGKATFTRSGVASFPKKKTYITIAVPGGLSGTPKFLVTMQGSPGDGVFIAYASKNSTTTIKVRLNKKSTKSTTVAWMVLD